jgi:glutaminase
MGISAWRRSATAGRRRSTLRSLKRFRSLFGICVVGARGGVYGAGDDDVVFTIMSVAKPLVFALICAALGPEDVRRRIGLNATGCRSIH